MLAGEQRGGRDHRHLLPCHRRHKRRAHRHLGLAETDVAAHQPVHRAAAFEIAQHIGNGAFLIVGFGPREAVDELVEAGRIAREHGCLPQRAGCGDLHQLAGDGGDALLELGAAALPCLAAEPVERHRLFGRAVAGEHVDILDRDEQLVAAGIFKRDAIVLALADRDRFKPEIAANAVLDMHHQIAARERLKFGEEGIGILALLLAPHQPIAEHVLLGEQLQRVAGKAGFERQHQHRCLGFCRKAKTVLPAVGERGGGAGFFEDRGYPACAAGGIGGEQRLAPGFGDGFQVCSGGFIDILAAPALGREIARRTEAEIDCRRAGFRSKAGGAVGRCLGQHCIELGAGEVERVGAKRAVGALLLARDAAALGVVIGDIGEPFLGRTQRALVDDHEIMAAEVIEHSGEPVLEKRQPMLHSGEAPPFGNGLIQRVLCGIGAEQLAVAAAEPLDAAVVDQRLGSGEQQVAVDPLDGALGGGIEQAQAFQLVAEEIEPEARIKAGGEDVDNRAAHRKFAVIDHRVGAAVALPDEQRGKAFVADLRADPKFAHGLAHPERGEHALEHGVDGGD